MHRRESCRICKHRSIGKSVAEKERPILLNAEYMINEERAKSSLLILTHHIQKPLNHLIFSGFTGMDLRGIEPLSESLSLAVSPITVADLTFPPQYAHRQAYDLSSFIIHLPGQSLPDKVSHKVDARFPMCECIRADEQQLGC